MGISRLLTADGLLPSWIMGCVCACVSDSPDLQPLTAVGLKLCSVGVRVGGRDEGGIELVCAVCGRREALCFHA